MANRGPIDDVSWPDALEARVVEAGPPPRLHGFDVWNDLAQHYRFAEVVLLALSGEPPSVEMGRAFDLALVLLSPTSIADAPGHTAALYRMMSAPPTHVVGVAALVLAEQVRGLVDAHGRWLEWLAAPIGDPPAEFAARDAADRASAHAVRAAIDASLCPVLARFDPTTDATALALLHACGLRTPLQIAAAVVTARVAVVAGEAERHTPEDLRTYPMNLPPFDYTEDGDG